MGIKKQLLNLIPSYRVGKSIQNQNSYFNQAILDRLDSLDYKIEYLFWLSESSADSDAASKRRVFSSLPKAHGRTRMIQLTNFEILKRINSICISNGIRYSISHGTLLGAERHHGFIPWDDDVDIVMPRPDFEQFSEVIKSASDIRLVCVYSFLMQRFYKVKFCNSDTFFVDILILDSIDLSENGAERLRALQLANQDFAGKMMEYWNAKGINRYDYGIPREDIELHIEMEEMISQRRKEFSFLGNGSQMTFSFESPSFTGLIEDVYEETELFPTEPVIFEGEEFPAYRNREIWLYNEFGDYWRFPHNIQFGHGDLTNLSDEDFRIMEEYGAVAAESEESGMQIGRHFRGANVNY